MSQKLWSKYDRTFEAKGQKVKRWQKNSLHDDDHQLIRYKDRSQARDQKLHKKQAENCPFSTSYGGFVPPI